MTDGEIKMKTKIYHFVAECPISTGCQLKFDIEAESLDEAFSIAADEAMTEFSRFTMYPVDDDGGRIEMDDGGGGRVVEQDLGLMRIIK